MRRDPTIGELAEHEVSTEAHVLVLEWRESENDRGTYVQSGVFSAVESFAEWMLQRRPPPGDALRDLAARLTPNPALTVEGTLAIILDAVDKIDEERLARALAFVNMRDIQRMACSPITDEQWKDGDLQSKLRMLHAARNLKAALRECSKA